MITQKNYTTEFQHNFLIKIIQKNIYQMEINDFDATSEKSYMNIYGEQSNNSKRKISAFLCTHFFFPLSRNTSADVRRQ